MTDEIKVFETVEEMKRAFEFPPRQATSLEFSIYETARALFASRDQWKHDYGLLGTAFNALQVESEADKGRIVELENRIRTPRAGSDRPPCGECGEARVIEFSVPSKIWNSFAEAHEYLCIWCADARAEKVGVILEPKFWWFGASGSSPDWQARMEGMIDVRDAEISRLKDALAKAPCKQFMARVWDEIMDVQGLPDDCGQCDYCLARAGQPKPEPSNAR